MNPTVDLFSINESHLNFWHEITNEPDATERQPLKPRIIEELRLQLIKYSQPDLANFNYHMYKWVVADKNSEYKVGVVSFNKMDLEHKIGRIGYTISKNFWGKGYGTLAVRILVKKIFAELDTERIEAECSLNNPASKRVLEKNGFTLEGIKRGYLEIHGARVDHYSFGLLRSDWKKIK